MGCAGCFRRARASALTLLRIMPGVFEGTVTLWKGFCEEGARFFCWHSERAPIERRSNNYRASTDVYERWLELGEREIVFSNGEANV